MPAPVLLSSWHDTVDRFAEVVLAPNHEIFLCVLFEHRRHQRAQTVKGRTLRVVGVVHC